MNIKHQYRQGDVLIEQVVKLPATALKQEMSRRVILAHGEATGHQHVLETADPADWWKQAEISAANEKSSALAGDLFLSLSGLASVTHPEHATIELPPGFYRVTRQREYSPQAIRNVCD